MARVRVLGVEALEPGKDAFLQLMLQNPVVAFRQDRFILRRPSPPATIGGGQVVDPLPGRRHKRFNVKRLEELEKLLVGTPEDILLQTTFKLGAASLDELVEHSGLEPDSAREAASSLIENNALISLRGERLLLPAETLESLTQIIQDVLAGYHQQYPLRLGMPREQLKSQMGLAPNVFDALISRMVEKRNLQEAGAKVYLPNHKIAFSREQQEKIDELLVAFEQQPFSPPSVKQSQDALGEELLNAIIAIGQLRQVGEDVLFRPGVYQQMREAVISHINAQGSITLAELRDKFDTSRKYAVAVLEHLDREGVTLRKGDRRVLRRP
jgi:selenocysteine-specific elongation factor